MLRFSKPFDRMNSAELLEALRMQRDMVQANPGAQDEIARLREIEAANEAYNADFCAPDWIERLARRLA